MEQGQAIPVVIPAPTGGWNAKDPVHAMPQNQAIELVNYFPDVSDVKHRGGSTQVWQASDTWIACWGLFSLPGPTNDFIFNLVGDVTNTSFKLFRTEESVWGTDDVTGAVTLGANSWRWTVFKNRIFAVNGTHQPIDIGTTGNANTTAWTGPADINNLINVDSYKGRLYFVEDGGTKIWYGGLEFITGALTGYETSQLLTKGGSLIALGVTTKTGPQNQMLFCALSSEGELLYFSGDYPGSATWQIVGRVFVGEPLGGKSLTYFGDLHVVSSEGIFNAAALLVTDRDRYPDIALTANISNAWGDAAKNWKYSAVSSSPWATAYQPLYRMRAVSVPQVIDGAAQYLMFVQNSLTGAWTKYEGMYSRFMAVTDRALYVTTSGTAAIGDNGVIIARHELPSARVGKDVGHTLEATCRMAFNYCGKLASAKHITEGKLFFTLTQAAGHDQTRRVIQIGADSDFKDEDNLRNLILKSVATDGTKYYVLLTDIRAEGTAFSLLFKSDFGDGYELSWNLFLIEVEPGGFLS